MNIVKVMGGLGNQLFQYAFARQFKSKGIDTRLDTTWYRKHSRKPIRDFVLDKFNTSFRTFDFASQKTIKETSFNKDIFNARNVNLYGYWQYLPYYEDSLSELRKEFTIKSQYLTDKYHHLLTRIKTDKSVSLHVRRGDYLEKGHTLLPYDYYKRALELVSGNVFVFSDDIEWCKKHFPASFNYIDGIEDYLAFDLMRQCTSNIISNSTFSWWAAFLNDNPQKKVIAPEIFIIRKEDEGEYSKDLHYPKDWITLPSKEVFDVLIVAHEKDFSKLPFVVEGIRNHVKGYNQIYIISNIPVKVHYAICVTEETQYDFSKFSRPRWYKQQFIKLFQTVTIDKYLVVDADCVINKDIEPKSGKFFITQDQCHEPYFNLMEKVFGLKKKADPSFISELMLFDRNIISEALDRYNLSDYGFIEAIRRNVAHPSGFSEFEFYGNYLHTFHPGLCTLEPLSLKSKGKKESYTPQEIKSFLLQNADKAIVTLHTWT